MSYDDLIYIDYKAKLKHPPMDRAKRAAQFSPFAALTGYDKAIEDFTKAIDLDPNDVKQLKRKAE